MWQQVFLSFIGLCAGWIVASGAVGLLIGLALVPRYAGITHTGDKILLYEDATMLGAILGNLFYLFHWQIRAGSLGLFLYGGFSGIFLGAWILALAEMASIFPILTRRIKFEKGLPLVIICVAVGKTVGSLYFFYKGWWNG